MPTLSESIDGSGQCGSTPPRVLNQLQDKANAHTKEPAHLISEAKKSASKLQKSFEHPAINITFKFDLEGYVSIDASKLELILAEKNIRRYCRGLRIYGDVDLRTIKNLKGVDFGNCLFLGNLDISGCDISGSNWQGATIRGKLSVDGADIRRANFKDFYVRYFQADEHTKRGGYIRRYQTNEKTTFSLIIHKLNAIAITFLNSTITINGITKDATIILSDFVTQYKILRSEENRAWRQRGDIASELSKLQLPDDQKIAFLVEKAEKEVSCKTYRALVHVLANHNKPTAITPVLHQTPPPPRPVVPIIPAPAVSVESVDELQDDGASDFPNPASPHSLTLAETCLKEALSSIDSSYYSKKNVDINELSRFYLLLKSAHGDEGNKQFDLLLQKMLIQMADRVIFNKPIPDLFFSYIEPLFIESRIMGESPPKFPTATKAPSRVVFFPSADPGDSQFKTFCEKLWAKTPLSILKDLGCVSGVTAERVAEKIKALGTVREAEQACLEKQLYLVEFILNNQFDRAAVVAGAIRSEYPKFPFEKDEHGIFMVAVTSLMSGYARAADIGLCSANTPEKEKAVLKTFDGACQPEKCEIAFKKLLVGSGTPLHAVYLQYHYFKVPMMEGIYTTLTLKNIAKKLLDHGSLLPNDIKRLFTCINNAFIWVGGIGEKTTLLNLCRAKLAGIDSSQPCAKMLTITCGIVEKSVTSEMFALSGDKNNIVELSQIKPKEFINIVDALLSQHELLNKINAVLTPIWEYEQIFNVKNPLKSAVRKLANGKYEFSNPANLKTAALVTNPKNHLLKLSHAKKLYEEKWTKIEKSITEFPYDFAALSRNGVTCDIERERGSVERYPVTSLLPIHKIRCAFKELMAALIDISDKLKTETKSDESNNTFGKAITRANGELSALQCSWEASLAAIFDCDLSTNPAVLNDVLEINATGSVCHR